MAGRYKSCLASKVVYPGQVFPRDLVMGEPAVIAYGWW